MPSAVASETRTRRRQRRCPVNPSSPPPVTLPMILPGILTPASSARVMPIDDHNAVDDGSDDCDSSLLQMTAVMITNSSGGRGGLSGVALGVGRIAIHSRHPPTVAGIGSAWCSGGRPTANAEIHTAAAPPRPGPASLLPPSL